MSKFLSKTFKRYYVQNLKFSFRQNSWATFFDGIKCNSNIIKGSI